MNILLLHQYFLSDGDAGGSRWNEHCRIWTKNGHKITVLAGMGHYTKQVQPSEKWIEIENISPDLTVIRCRVGKGYHKNYLERFWALVLFSFTAFWAGLFRVPHRSDLVIATSPPLHLVLVGYVLSKIKGVKFVFEVRDLWVQFAIELSILKNKVLIKLAEKTERFLYQKATKIITLTPAFKSYIIQKYNINPTKIHTISNGADFDFLKAYQNFNRSIFREKQGWAGKQVIVYAGALGKANHLGQVIEAAQLLQDTNLLFVLIGDGHEKAMLQKRIQVLGLSNLQVLDSIDKREVFAYILAADAGLAVLQKSEGFKTIYSNKTFDYMACAKPVLMAIGGISRALIEDNTNAGVFLEPENPNDWNKKLRVYFNDQSNILQQGQNGYEYAKRHFDRKALAKKYANILEGSL